MRQIIRVVGTLVALCWVAAMGCGSPLPAGSDRLRVDSAATSGRDASGGDPGTGGLPGLGGNSGVDGFIGDGGGTSSGGTSTAPTGAGGASTANTSTGGSNTAITGGGGSSNETTVVGGASTAITGGGGTSTATTGAGGTVLDTGNVGTAGASGLGGSPVEAGLSDGPADQGVDDVEETGAICEGDQIFCGCGCCGRTDYGSRCYYPGKGETLATVHADDMAWLSVVKCTLILCSGPLRHTCCADLPPEPSSVGSYQAGYSSSDGEQVRIVRRGPDGQYAELILTGDSAQRKGGFAIDVVPGSWGVESGAHLSQGGSAISDNAIGGHGTVRIWPSGSTCLVDAHLTLFSLDAAAPLGVPQAVRLDVDSLIIASAPASLCGAEIDASVLEGSADADLDLGVSAVDLP